MSMPILLYRIITKISSCQVYAVSRWGSTEQKKGVLLVSFSFCFLRKISRGYAHSNQGKSLDPGPLLQP